MGSPGVLPQNVRGVADCHPCDLSGSHRTDDLAVRQTCRSERGVRLIARQLHCDVRGALDDVTSGGASFVTVMQAADFPKREHVTLGEALHASGRWRVFRQRQMSARSVIVRQIGGQDSAQMLLAEYHHVVQAIAPD